MENEDDILELPPLDNLVGTPSGSETIEKDRWPESDVPIDTPSNSERVETAHIADPPSDGDEQSSIGTIIGWVLASKVILLVFGAASYELFQNKWVETWRGWLDIWYRWDSMRYIRIAEFGYSNTGPDRHDLMGFPLYGWVVRGFAYVFQDYLLSGFIVTLIATLAAGILLYRLTKLDDNETVARNSVWFLLIFPTAYFLQISYPESFFLALALGSLFAARKDHWAVAVGLAILAGMTRINGIVLTGALAVEAIHQYYKLRKFKWQYLLVALVPLGLCVHLLVNYSVTGDAFTFMQIGRENYFKSFSTPWAGINQLIGVSGQNDVGFAMMSGMHELLFALLGLVCTILSAIFLRPSYTVWIAGNWLLFMSVGFVLGVPRYTLALFPIFILFGKLGQRPLWFGILTITSLLFLAQFAIRFVTGTWSFG